MRDMVHEQTSQTDRRNIGKARQFGAAELESLPLFANSFLSDMGLQPAFTRLDDRERAFLHLLALQDDPVRISFFHPLYQTGSAISGGTYTQRYTDLFKEVRKRLIRGGLLLWAEIGNGDAKLERYRFALPRLVIQNLPPLITESQALEPQDISVYPAFQERLTRLLQKDKRSQDGISITKGQIFLNGNPFSVDALQEWRELNWISSIENYRYKQRKQQRRTTEVLPKQDRTQPSALIRHGLSQLPAGHWVKTDVFQHIFDLQYADQNYPDLHTIFNLGWQLGSLERTQHDETSYYRLRSEPDWTNQPIEYLKKDGKIILVDVDTIPLSAFSVLSQYGDLAIQREQLILKPNLIKLSHTTREARENPLATWLQQYSPIFAQAFQKVQEQWGKLLVHQQLLYAQVSDLSLRVTLEKNFDDGSILFLPDGWMAFPPNLLSKIDTVVNRSGHVIKKEILQ